MTAARVLERIGLGRVTGSLCAQFMLILTGVGLVGSLAIAGFLAIVITPSFNRMEKAAVAGSVERTRTALQGYAARVETATRDYGDHDAGDAESFVAFDGRFPGATLIEQGVGRPDLRDQLIAAAPGIALPVLLAKARSHSFYMRFGNRLVAVGIAKVRRGDRASTGYVVMARELTSAQLSALLRMPARIDLATAARGVSQVSEPDRLVIGVPIAGVDRASIGTIRFDVPRDLSMLGRQTLALAVAGAVLLIVLVLMVLWRMIARRVLNPLNRVERHMGVVRTSGTLDPLAADARVDEIGRLINSFNAMLRQLSDLREQVEVQSFALGKSESAIAVMHNVRNALAPIATILSQEVPALAADRLLIDRAVGELAGDAIPPARRRKLAAYVAASVVADRSDRDDRVRGLAAGRAALGNVLEIIGHQQQQALEPPPLSPCDLTALVMQNAAIALYAGDASIAFVAPSQPYWALGHRVTLSQVIGNLLANAGEAIVARGGEGGAITVSIVEIADRVELTIRDNGEGFAAGMAPRFFQRGFSTRAQKSGGLGLHWCANVMLAMGGSLRLESDGLGTGARAVIALASLSRRSVPMEQAA